MNTPATTNQPTDQPTDQPGITLGPVGIPWRPRALAVTVVALIVLAGLIVAGTAAGSASLSPADVVRTLLGNGTYPQHLIVFDLRLPRILTGVLVGICLGTAGALTQTFTNNPLATPDVIGVTAGASTGAVAAILVGGGSYAVSDAVLGSGIPVAATIGALTASALVYGLGWRDGIDSYRLILVGIGVSSVLTALTSYLLVRAQITDATRAAAWLVGSLSGTSWTSLTPLAVVTAVAAPLAVACSAPLAVAQLGDETATGVGLAVQRHRLLVIALAVLLTGAAVAAAGPVGFVAFVVPQIALRTTAASRPPILLSGLLGACLVTAADLAARTAFPYQVPVGLLTTLVGAPYLIWLLVRHRKEIAR
ncbi:iron chelate uptake ABC transporter family permease subunit [Kineosporia sp. J2-2]|uniref:Iron chelate uptake ABC transporter family permease subunit n=1 Tax=Kineosporia corallincola TaxID=2835133 RepID=A0ABS5TBC3_9ACTN|nr:iron chelate uptake ABC transporter family permease subunit [Kineosporia corallincola]MBT0768336.1 iron chelate uptake ABC transporter family permease subunit [Kineosporia corallincola]